MTCDEIFSEMSTHMVKGIMFHAQLADYFDFLGLKGYKRLHEYHFLDETINFRKLNRYYINTQSRLIAEKNVENPHAIPDSWHRYSREDIDTATRRGAIKTAFNSWVEWEKSTLELYENSYSELCKIGEYAPAMFVKEFMCDVECELKCAMRMVLALKSVDYDMSVIIPEQQEIHNKYKGKTENLISTM